MLSPNTKLGPYEIISQIGAGGMGEVYKARDTRLDRIVALKVLPAHLADQPDRRERFEREARTIAGLNHPHICTLHDIGRQDGTDFLVMEYVEGETLAAQLLKGPLPAEEVMRYGIEISDALDKAHRKGVTHRDIKPGNIMLTKSGTKLLDFGLAKLRQEASPALPVSQLPTLKESPTVEGTILGTLQYMSPEQLEGKMDEIDGRTDIFAFGAVMYEMATGRKAFEGKSTVSLIGAILKDNPPPISSLQPMTPPALDRVVRKCLAKDPGDRWQSAHDVTDELKWISEGGSQPAVSVPAAAAQPRPARTNWPTLGLGALVLLAAVAGFAVWKLRPTPAPAPVIRTVITLPAGQQLDPSVQSSLAISPDGSRLVYVAAQGGKTQLYIRSMDSLEVRALADTDGAISPFFSPDGQWIGFNADGKLKKIPVNGGAAITLVDAAISGGASWSTQGSIVFSVGPSNLRQVPEAGGAPQALTQLGKGEIAHAQPDVLPGGKATLFTVAAPTPHVAVYSLETGQRKDLIQNGTSPRYLLSGHLVYSQNGNLMAVPFDPGRLEVTGAAVPALEGVMQSVGPGATAQYSVSDTGTLVYIPAGSETVKRQLLWVTRGGLEQPLPAPPHEYDNPRISPDGKRVAVEIGPQVWVYDIARDTLTRLTFAGSTNNNPIWAPDGTRVAFYSNASGQANLYWQMADGSGGLERLSTSERGQIPTSFSPDGQHLAFHALDPNRQRDIWVLSLSDHKEQPFLQTQFTEGAPVFSPDGHWLAYVSDESGRPEVYVQPYPGPGGKWQISSDGGTEPAWNPKGGELFYRSGDKMMAVTVQTAPTFSAGKAQVLFQGTYAARVFPQLGTRYDVSPDGQRFLMVKEVQAGAEITQIDVVQNWFEELKQRAPAGKQ
jgi:eukaryotic-like serine/threonine-protein kinase